jgi:hypothetical protein
LVHIFFPGGTTVPSGPGPSQCRAVANTLRHTTVGRTPLDEWSARRRDRYLTKINIHKRQTSMPPGGIRTHNPSKRSAANLRLRPRCCRDRQYIGMDITKLIIKYIIEITFLGTRLYVYHPCYKHKSTKFVVVYLSSKFFSADWVCHRNQDLHILDDSGTDDSLQQQSILDSKEPV